jgi:hypothetical protein
LPSNAAIGSLPFPAGIGARSDASFKPDAPIERVAEEMSASCNDGFPVLNERHVRRGEAIMKPQIFSLVALAFLVADCSSGPSVAQMPSVPECRKFSTPVAIEGEQTQQLTGYACRQPDGTWKPVDAPPPSYASAALYGGPVPPPPDALIAPNCAYPMAAIATEQCNWYLNRHKFGHR